MESKIEEFIKNLDFLDIRNYLGYSLQHFMIYKIGEAARKVGFYVGEEINNIDLMFFDHDGKKIVVLEFEQSNDFRKKIDGQLKKLEREPVPFKIYISSLPDYVEEIRKKIEQVSSKDKAATWIFGHIDFEDEEKFGQKHWWWSGNSGNWFYEYRNGRLIKKLRIRP